MAEARDASRAISPPLGVSVYFVVIGCVVGGSGPLSLAGAYKVVALRWPGVVVVVRCELLLLPLAFRRVK